MLLSVFDGKIVKSEFKPKQTKKKTETLMIKLQPNDLPRKIFYVYCFNENINRIKKYLIGGYEGNFVVQRLANRNPKFELYNLVSFKITKKPKQVEQEDIVMEDFEILEDDLIDENGEYLGDDASGSIL